jgi:hypothetical protein
MRSKAMKLAWALYKKGLSFGEAQRKAWKVLKLKEAMKVGEVEFTFLKKDGSIRPAKGTLQINYQKKTNRTSPIDVIAYFDIEKQSFRSFKAENLIAA